MVLIFCRPISWWAGLLLQPPPPYHSWFFVTYELFILGLILFRKSWRWKRDLVLTQSSPYTTTTQPFICALLFSEVWEHKQKTFLPSGKNDPWLFLLTLWDCRHQGYKPISFNKPLPPLSIVLVCLYKKKKNLSTIFDHYSISYPFPSS